MDKAQSESIHFFQNFDYNKGTVSFDYTILVTDEILAIGYKWRLPIMKS